MAPCLISMAGILLTYVTDLGLGKLMGCLGTKSEFRSEPSSYDRWDGL